jgi:eukaryotic-like serine/threonine-protein kinase
MAALLTRVREALADRYVIECELGHGAMAVVYLAQDLKHRRRVAIKVLRPELAAAVGSERFLREIEIAAGLNHPNILALHDSGDVDGIPFYVMPFVEGETLRDRLASHRAVALDDAIRIAREVGDALDYAHEHGLVHRDVKPANVLFQAGHALVADFGIARAVREAGGTKMTETGMVVGTVAYMSPEQAVGDPNVDARSDVYALGCLLYEMLAGRAPFNARNAQAMLAQKVVGSAPRLTEVRPELPPTLDPVVQRALAKEPDDRFQTPGAFTTALQGAATSSAVGVDTRTRPTVWLRTALAGARAVARAVGGAARIDPRRSPRRFERLAVLPISDFRSSPGQDYLLEGIHQALISELQKAGVTIIGRRGVLQYAGTDTPARAIAEHLNVDAIVDASLLRSDATLSLQVGLIDAETEAQIWSGDFSEKMGNVLAIYRRVTRAIIDEIRFDISPEAEERLAAATREVDPEAYDLVLRGTFHWNKLTPEGIDASQRYFEQAIARDPMIAAAHAGIANMWLARIQMGLLPASEAGPWADAAAARAVELDPSLSLPEVLYMRAVDRMYRAWDSDAAIEAFEAAVEADPNDARISAYFAHTLHLVGRPEEGVAMIHRALELDPDDRLIQALYGMELLYEHRFETAVERMEEALRVTPNDPIALSTLRTAYHMTGQYEKAIDIWRHAYTAQQQPERVAALERGWRDGGYSAALRAVAELMWEQARERSYVTPWQIGTLYTRAGDEDHALDFLERAYEAGDTNIPYLTIDPIFDFMRDNPRFRALVERLGLRGS